MLTTELIEKWQSQSSPVIDLLALADCSDLLEVTPREIDGKFWIFIESDLPPESFIKTGKVFSVGTTKIQIKHPKAAVDSLRTQQDMYIQRLKKSGKKIKEFNCPHCNDTNETLANETDTDWDTIATCVSCNEIYKKITPANMGEVLATLKR